MRPSRVHITGGSGSGTTTLGRVLASAWSVPHADSDDYFWIPTSPPYTTKRPPEERIALMEQVFVGGHAWVLSGSMRGWGVPLEPRFEAVVFLTLNATDRIDRVRARERLRYGEAILPGGDRADAHAEFMAYAKGYDDPAFTGRSRAYHDAWLAGLACPVLRLDSAAPVDELVAAVLDWQPERD
jgi:hypothetical protein